MEDFAKLGRKTFHPAFRLRPMSGMRDLAYNTTNWYVRFGITFPYSHNEYAVEWRKSHEVLWVISNATRRLLSVFSGRAIQTGLGRPTRTRIDVMNLAFDTFMHQANFKETMSMTLSQAEYEGREYVSRW